MEFFDQIRSLDSGSSHIVVAKGFRDKKIFCNGLPVTEDLIKGGGAEKL
jgi:hypothetical protein